MVVFLLRERLFWFGRGFLVWVIRMGQACLTRTKRGKRKEERGKGKGERGKLRERKANRLNVWNYDSIGYYYITINAKHHNFFFGQIRNCKMELSEIGLVAQQCWSEIPDHYKNVFLDGFIIMPNHIHGIIKILPSISFVDKKAQYKEIPLIIGSYKSAVSKIAHKKGFAEFSWHRSFYDHIVRDEKDLHRIRKYIRNNPSNF